MEVGDTAKHLIMHGAHLCPTKKYPAPNYPVPGGSDGKESACNAGDLDSVPGLGRSLGKGNDNLPQYSCLENSMDRRVWWNTGRGVAKSQIPTNTFIFFCATGELSFNLVTLGVMEADK